MRTGRVKTGRFVARLVAAGLAVGLMVGLAGCGPVNAGDAGRSAFNETFADDHDIAELRIVGGNALAWSGTVRGTVVARDDLGDKELGELVDRIGEYSTGSPANVSVAVDVLADGVLFPVRPARTANAELGALVTEVRDDARISGAVLGTGPELPTDVSFTVVAAEAAFEVAAAHTADVNRLGVAVDPSSTAKLTVDASDGTVELSGAVQADGGVPENWIETSAQLWAALKDATQLSAFKLRADELEVTVERDEDVEIAQRLIVSELGDSSIRFTVSSGLFELTPGASGQTARDLIVLLEPAVRERIVTSWTDDEVLQLTVRSADGLQPVADAVSALPEATSFSTIALILNGEDAPTATPQPGADPRVVSVFAAPAEIAERTARAVALFHTAGVVTMSTAADRVEVRVDSPDDALAKFAAPLKAAARAGDWACVAASGSGDLLCLTAADAVDADDVANQEQPSLRAFVAAWNEAPPPGG